MEQKYFSLTITANDEISEKHDAHELKKTLNINRLQAWNKGDIEEGNIRFKQFCLQLPPEELEYSDYFFSAMTVTELLTLPNELDKTFHFITDSSTERQCNGCYLNENNIKKLALLECKFRFYAKLHFISRQHEYPFSEYINPIDVNVNQPLQIKTSFYLSAYKHKLAEISEKLGFKENDSSFNYDDIRSSRKKPYGLSSFRYCKESVVNQPIINHFEEFINELYQYKPQILALGNEVDVSYGMSVTGHMPNEYEFEISADTIRKLAEMRISLDFDMYFKSNY